MSCCWAHIILWWDHERHLAKSEFPKFPDEYISSSFIVNATFNNFQIIFFSKLDCIYFLDGLNLQIRPQEPAGRTLSAWKQYRPLWRRLYQHGWTACTRYSSSSFLQSLTVKIFSAALQLVTENQQPSLFLPLFSSNTMYIRTHTLLDFWPEKDPSVS